MTVEWIRCDCGSRFPRPGGEVYDRCLGCVLSGRLLASGIAPDDPGLVIIRQCNAVAYATAQAGAA
jgi:hypothetical protein